MYGWHGIVDELNPSLKRATQPKTRCSRVLVCFARVPVLRRLLRLPVLVHGLPKHDRVERRGGSDLHGPYELHPIGSGRSDVVGPWEQHHLGCSRNSRTDLHRSDSFRNALDRGERWRGSAHHLLPSYGSITGRDRRDLELDLQPLVRFAQHWLA